MLALKICKIRVTSRFARGFGKEQSLRRGGGLFPNPAPLFLHICGGFFVLPAETLNASGGVHQLLLAREKRVAIGADFQVDVALVGGAGGKRVSACTVHAHFFVL